MNDERLRQRRQDQEAYEEIYGKRPNHKWKDTSFRITGVSGIEREFWKFIDRTTEGGINDGRIYGGGVFRDSDFHRAK